MLIGSLRPGICTPVFWLLRVAMPMPVRPTPVTPSICFNSRMSVSGDREHLPPADTLELQQAIALVARVRGRA
jgi:hypothetical protein